MKKKSILLLIAVIVIATAALVVVHLLTDAVPEGNAVVLQVGGRTRTVPLDRLDQGAFHGDLTNGKGETAGHDFRGVELRTLLDQQGFDLPAAGTATVLAQDQYAATLTLAEIRTPGKVYIAVQEDGETLAGLEEGSAGAQLVVFGDPNAKRCVRMLESIALVADAP
jgi:hypothetical protein